MTQLKAEMLGRAIVFEGDISLIEQEGGYCSPDICLGVGDFAPSLTDLIQERFREIPAHDLAMGNKLFQLRIRIEGIDQ